MKKKGSHMDLSRNNAVKILCTGKGARALLEFAVKALRVRLDAFGKKLGRRKLSK